LTIAAELAMNRGDVKGPGSFLPVLMDELANLKPEVIRGLAKVEVHL
jgi:thiamine-phosphate diphosphorylase/hydroxyethylthiazole kinase